MSATYTITDDAILAAWGGAPEDWEPVWRQAAAEFLRRRLEAEDAGDDVVFRQSPEMRRPVDVTALRDRLGGWDAVWRAVLAEVGFEASKQYADEWDLDINGVMVTVHHWAGRVGWELALRRGGESVPLRSPADLRVRVGHARGLFGG